MADAIICPRKVLGTYLSIGNFWKNPSPAKAGVY